MADNQNSDATGYEIQPELEADSSCCENCGYDFGKGLRSRQARGMNICVQCAIDNDQEMHDDDIADLSEEYWSSKADA